MLKTWRCVSSTIMPNWFALMVIGALLATGCACHHYGGNMFPIRVMLAADEQNQNQGIYLIPDEVWTGYPDSFDPQKLQPSEVLNHLRQYRVNDDGTKEVDSVMYDIVVWEDKTKKPVVVRTITPQAPREKVIVSTKSLHELDH